MSAGIGVVPSPYDHELQQVPVGIARVHARSPSHGGRRRARPGLPRSSAPAPSSSACSADDDPSHTKHRSPHGGCAAGARNEKPALPERGTVEVDHLVAHVDRHDGRLLGDRRTRVRGRTRASRRCRCIGSETWSKPGRSQATAVQPRAVGRDDLAPVVLGQCRPTSPRSPAASWGTCCRCADSPTPTCSSRRRATG